MKVRILLVSTALAVFSVLGTAAPANANVLCHDSIDEACAVAAFVICKVINKGQTCLN